jgi:DNA polymerase-3 subunit delta
MIARVATARQGGAGADAVARQLGVPAWKVKKPLQQLGGWRPEGLAVAVQAVARADAEVKGGGDDAAYALERALLDVAAARGR